MTATTTVHELEAREQQITKVNVFTDRAEVRRLVKATLKVGVNEVVLKNVCESLVHESLRVEGRGKATIHDVVVKHVAALKEESDAPKVAELRASLKKEKELLQTIADRGTVVQKSIENLDSVFGQVGSGLVNPPKEHTGVVLNEGTLDSLSKFFEFYGNNSEKYREKLRATETEHRDQEEKVQKIQQSLNLLQNQHRGRNHSQSAIITLECSEESDIELDVIYQVHNAGWSPSYDIRVDTEKPSMNITYFGKIRQHTNEDWTNAPLVLSTAQPCLGGRIPELGTLDAVFHVRYEVARTQAHSLFGAPRGNVQMQQSMAQTSFSLASAHAPPPQPMEVAVASEVNQNALSTEFKILREASIPHGTNDHKVTIGIVTLSPKLVHESVPSKNAAAFLTASAINTSELAFLAGSSSVYLNNAFVAKSHLKNVSPGERFTCSLGVDTAIRVEYKPAKKYHEEGGYITKHSANVTEQTISLKNTRSEQPVLITIKHHVPRSTEEKIRVKLVSPVATPYDAEKASAESDNAEPAEGAKLNSSNNLEWTVKLAPASSQDLVIKYVVEHPKEEKMTAIHEFDIREQLIDNITILSDRAEVKRHVKVSVNAGVNEVQLKNLSHCVVRDSVRVEGRGNATICDVTEKEVPALRSEIVTPRIAELRKELDHYDGVRRKLEDQRDILKKKMEGLDRSVGDIGKGVMNPPKDSGTLVIDDSLLGGLQKLFDYHEEQSEKLKENLREKQQQIEDTIEKINKISDELNGEINANTGTYSHTAFITLEALNDADVELDVTYQVFQAGWEPSYDIRVDTQKPSLVITYYGKIYNTSGEDWNDFSAALSTAQPCLGGHIPELGTLDAHFDRPVKVYKVKRMVTPLAMMRRIARDSDNEENERSDDDMGFAEAEMERSMAPPSMEVSQNALSTEYKIAKRATIPHGILDHKVTIGTADLTPTLVHESVPSKNAAAFLTASVVNSSPLAFLAGETSIFLDNAFVAKSHLKNVSPGERFTCSLGVDTAIRVEYKPAKKYHEEGGYITKHSANVTEQTISLKNTRSMQPVLLTIKHHVPRSTEEKIRVKLIAPSAAPFDAAATGADEVVEPKEGARLNKDNNLEWTVILAPASSKDLVVKWVVEHPKDQKIEFRENH